MTLIYVLRKIFNYLDVITYFYNKPIISKYMNCKAPKDYLMLHYKPILDDCHFLYSKLDKNP